jgi:hypothetical protein
VYVLGENKKRNYQWKRMYNVNLWRRDKIRRARQQRLFFVHFFLSQGLWPLWVFCTSCVAMRTSAVRGYQFKILFRSKLYTSWAARKKEAIIWSSFHRLSFFSPINYRQRLRIIRLHTHSRLRRVVGLLKCNKLIIKKCVSAAIGWRKIRRSFMAF